MLERHVANQDLQRAPTLQDGRTRSRAPPPERILSHRIHDPHRPHPGPSIAMRLFKPIQSPVSGTAKQSRRRSLDDGSSPCHNVCSTTAIGRAVMGWTSPSVGHRCPRPQRQQPWKLTLQWTPGRPRTRHPCPRNRNTCPLRQHRRRGTWRMFR